MKKIITNFLLNFKYAFRIHKPILTIRLIKTLFNVYILKKKPLRYVDMAIDYKCNLRCEHCFATVLKNDKRDKINPDDYEKIAKESMNMGAVNFSFQGGEPTLDLQKLITIIKRFSPYKNLISVTTNATLLDKEKIILLKKAGVDILTISLDSGIPEEHDNFRGGQGSFNKAMRTIDIALKHGINITIGATITKQNLYSEGMKKLIDFAQEKNIILFLIFAVPAGNWKESYSVLLSEDDINCVRALEKKYKFIRTDFYANWSSVGCGAVKEILYITPYGDVFACPFIHMSLGNIKEESLVKIRNRSLKLPYFETYYKRCLCGEDKEFIDKYMRKINEYNNNGKIISYKDLFNEHELGIENWGGG